MVAFLQRYALMSSPTAPEEADEGTTVGKVSDDDAFGEKAGV